MNGEITGSSEDFSPDRFLEISMAKIDKDAEKEKLRLQFEKEAKSRESSQVMSSLLLQGATMTRKHCKTCGDPIFRQEGEEFCPGCRKGEQAAAEKEVDGQKEQSGRKEAGAQLTGARTAIMDKIEELTEKVEQEEDIQKMKEYLSAMKEAVEVLRMMDEIGK
jgi:uncharacterized Zn finger protein (UPF0148 family)